MTLPPDTAATPGLLVRGLKPPLRLADYRLAAFDMDSTLINIECIDEIADAAGKKAEVAAITEAAMRGEISDFRASLQRRLALLAGVPAGVLDEVYAQRLRLNPGVPEFLAACHGAGLRTLLVSGGFTWFAERVAQRLGMHAWRANELDIVGGRLSGRVRMQPWGDIVDGEMKRRTMLEQAAAIGATPAQCIAVGDGANDLPMMGAAGLAIAFHGKPRVRDAAQLAVVEGGLDRVLEVLRT